MAKTRNERQGGQLFSAMRSAPYRRFWLGNFCAVSGQQMMWVAQGWLVYDLTGSPPHPGYAGLVTALPALILSLLGGVIADRLDQRKVITVTQIVTAAAVLALAFLTLFDIVRVWQILVVAFILGATQAFNNPARQSMFPQLIEKKDLTSAVSLNSMVWQGTRIIAPAIAGVLVSVSGMPLTLFVCAATFLPMGIVVLGMKVEQPVRTQTTSMFTDLSEGVRFIAGNFLFAFLVGMSFFGSFFGNSALQLMPVFARDILNLGPSGLGVLMSISGVGTFLGILIAGYLGSYERKGVLLIGGATIYGLFLILFANATVYAVSLAFLFFMGIALQIYMITLQTTLQLRVPDELRGRVMGIYGMTHNIGPLGALQAGLIADAFGAPMAVTVSGFAIIAFTLGVAMSRSEVRGLQTVAATT